MSITVGLESIPRSAAEAHQLYIKMHNARDVPAMERTARGLLKEGYDKRYVMYANYFLDEYVTTEDPGYRGSIERSVEKLAKEAALAPQWQRDKEDEYAPLGEIQYHNEVVLHAMENVLAIIRGLKTLRA